MSAISKLLQTRFASEQECSSVENERITMAHVIRGSSVVRDKVYHVLLLEEVGISAPEL